MSGTAAQINANARSIRARLMMPGNAVVDPGIDLQRKSLPQPPQSVPSRPKVIFRSSIMAARHRRELDVERVAQIVAEFYKVPLGEVKCDGRRPALICKVRQVICHLAHQMLRRSYPEIGRALKYRDHTTAMYGNRLIAQRLMSDQRYAQELQQLRLLVETEMWSE